MIRRKINIGLIGSGFMGKTHTYALKNLDSYYADIPFSPHLHTLCTRKEESAEKFAKLHGFANFTIDADKLINDPEIDVVDISTPNACHFDMLLKSLRAGKHVYCEKPVVITNEESDIIRQELKLHPNLICQVVFNNRFLPAVIRANQLFSEGRLGKLIFFKSSYLHASAIDSDKKQMGWRMEKSISGGGALYDLGSHAIDLVKFITGENFIKVFGKAQNIYKKHLDLAGNECETDVDEAFYMTAVTESGAVGTVEASKIAIGTNDDFNVEIYGTLGSLKFNLMEPSWLYFYDGTKSSSPYGGESGYTRIECVQRFSSPGGIFPSIKAPIGWERGHVGSYYSFLDCIHKGFKASPSIEDGLYVNEVMYAAYSSDKSGKWEEVKCF